MGSGNGGNVSAELWIDHKKVTAQTNPKLAMRFTVETPEEESRSDQRIRPGQVDVDLAFLTRPGRDPKSKCLLQREHH
jgi:hypothetical protein